MLSSSQDAAGSRSGPSMVQQHHEKLQIEREEAAIQKLQSSLPKLCRPVLAVALKDCDFDADRALLMLRQFQSDAFDELALIHRKRRRAEASRRTHDASPDSRLDGDGCQRRRESRHKHKKSSKSKKEKRKRSKQQHARLSDSPDSGEEERALEFGSFGIIRESDYALKKPEFAAWAAEVQHIDIESLPRNDERELWRSFMEDFNTCTLPDRKYYDLSVHARKLGAAAAASGAREDANTFVDDERLRRAELMEEHRREQDKSARDTMAKMMLTSEHLSELKQREMIRMQAQEAYKMGDMVKAQKLMKKLNPDEEDLRDLEHYNN